MRTRCLTADRRADREHLHADIERARLVVEDAGEHSQPGGSDRAETVVGPRRFGAWAADENVATDTPRLGEKRDQVSRCGKVRQQVVVEGTAQHLGRVIDEAPSTLITTHRVNDANEGPAIPAEHLRKPCAVGVRCDRAREHRRIRTAVLKAELLELLQVPGHRNHGAAHLNRRTHHPATDGARRPEDYDRGLDCPIRGTFTPSSGMVGGIPPALAGRAATIREFPDIK